MKQWLIARDEKCYHVREIISVTHQDPGENPMYHTRQRGSFTHVEDALEFARKVEKESRR